MTRKKCALCGDPLTSEICVYNDKSYHFECVERDPKPPHYMIPKSILPNMGLPVHVVFTCLNCNHDAISHRKRKNGKQYGRCKESKPDIYPRERCECNEYKSDGGKIQK
ncbi:MAG: hypothetical protein K8823_1526 [Cenarchaeum symbiont of Oopsacas minuta]|nr:hypothetical protein [Cenarchaeum symbiont of Oopsacas minuta]